MMPINPDQPLVETRGLGKAYATADGPVNALAALDVEIARGEFVAVMGPSGSGKSTFANIVGCLDVATTGTCRLAGHDTGALDADGRAALRRDYLGFVFQSFNLLPYADAVSNVELPLTYRGIGHAERRSAAEAALAAVGLADRRHHKPDALSGGQQQRVAIARALVTRPALVIADEPTAALDRETGREVMALLEQLNHELGITLVVITHDPGIGDLAQRVLVFGQGRLVWDRRKGLACV